jgi:hypothetical protein
MSDDKNEIVSDDEDVSDHIKTQIEIEKHNIYKKCEIKLKKNIIYGKKNINKTSMVQLGLHNKFTRRLKKFIIIEIKNNRFFISIEELCTRFNNQIDIEKQHGIKHIKIGILIANYLNNHYYCE